MLYSVDEWTVQMHLLSNKSQISNSFDFNFFNSSNKYSFFIYIYIYI